MLPLLFVPVGEEQTIRRVTGKDESKSFVEKLGLVQGAVVTVIAQHRGDLIVSVKDVRVALSKELASLIKV